MQVGPAQTVRQPYNRPNLPRELAGSKQRYGFAMTETPIAEAF